VILNRKEKRRVGVLVESRSANRERQQDSFVKVTFGGLFGTVPELLFEKKGLIPAMQRMLIYFLSS
jgi:hypothetical protein